MIKTWVHNQDGGGYYYKWDFVLHLFSPNLYSLEKNSYAVTRAPISFCNIPQDDNSYLRWDRQLGASSTGLYMQCQIYMNQLIYCR